MSNDPTESIAESIAESTSLASAEATAESIASVSTERQLAELRDAVLDDWILVTSHSTDALRAMQGTFSWRVTRPLRVFRTFSYKTRDLGVLPASRLAAGLLARKLGGRA